MSLDIIDLITSLERLFFGLTFFLAPDYFWNPQDGVFRSLQFIKETSLESNHLDAITRSCLMGCGASFLGICIGHSLMTDPKSKIFFLEMKVVQSLALFVLLFHTAFMNPTEAIGKAFLGFMAGVKLYGIFWMTDVLVRSKQPVRLHHHKHDRASGLGIAVVAFSLLYTAVFASMLYLRPYWIAPDGPMAYFVKTSLQDNSFDDVNEFACRMEGAALFAYLPPLMYTLWHPSLKSVQASTRYNVIVGILYLITFLRMAFDTTGYANKQVFALQCVVQVLITYFIGTLGGAQHVLPEKDMKKHPISEAPVPDLTTEGTKKVQ